MTETERTWTERVREWKASGLAAPEFVQGRGYQASTLRYWASRLQGVAEGRAWPARVRMARVKVAKASSESLVVLVGAVRIEVRPGFDSALLRDVVDALGRAS
jgi:hypothetical protein